MLLISKELPIESLARPIAWAQSAVCPSSAGLGARGQHPHAGPAPEAGSSLMLLGTGTADTAHVRPVEFLGARAGSD